MHCPVCAQLVVDRVNPVAYCAALAVSPRTRKLLDRFLKSFGQFLDRHLLLAAMYADRADGGPLNSEKSLHVHIYWLRGRLADGPLVIESTPGRGGGVERRLTWRAA
jgi:DNA-binding response OmpR family regulator